MELSTKPSESIGLKNPTTRIDSEKLEKKSPLDIEAKYILENGERLLVDQSDTYSENIIFDPADRERSYEYQAQDTTRFVSSHVSFSQKVTGIQYQFTCPYCGNKFTTSLSLPIHQNTIHCVHCSNYTKISEDIIDTNSTLLRNLSTIHNESITRRRVNEYGNNSTPEEDLLIGIENRLTNTSPVAIIGVYTFLFVSVDFLPFLPSYTTIILLLFLTLISYMLLRGLSDVYIGTQAHETIDKKLVFRYLDEYQAGMESRTGEWKFHNAIRKQYDPLYHR